MQEDERTGQLPVQNQTLVERKAALELTATRAFDAPIHVVYEAWTKPDLFRRWWTPKSSGMSLLSCEMDVRVGGSYRLVFSHPALGTPMSFYGSYREVKPDSRLVWTNEESPEGAVTTVTFEEKDGRTLLVLHELHSSNQALEESLAGVQGALPEQFAQLDQLLAGQP